MTIFDRLRIMNRKRNDTEQGETVMRVIAGSAKHLSLKTVEGLDTRPTTDRIKETLFNMIAPYLADCNFLDLFSGSGAIGIEALSRGARCAVFVEQNRKAVSCIRENLRFTKLEAGAKVYEGDVFLVLKQLSGRMKFDYIFMDPPYNLLLEKQVLLKLRDLDLMEKSAVIIVEASMETEFDYVEEFGFSVIKEKRYKTNKHVFLEVKEDWCA